MTQNLNRPVFRMNKSSLLPLRSRQTFIRKAALGFALVSSLALPLQQVRAANNTADVVVTGLSAGADLSAASSYASAVPGTTNDLQFNATNTYPATFAITLANLSIGTLDDQSATAITISSSTKTITFNTALNSVSPTAAGHCRY
jgi:hypothetical protein